MNNEIRKLLTEKVLGECWHQQSFRYATELLSNRRSYYCVVCGLENKKSGKLQQRLFCTPQDAQDVKDKMVEKGKWEEFYFYVKRKYVLIANAYPPIDHDVSRWLFSYTTDSQGNRTGYRLCDLAGEFMEVGK